VHRAGDGSGGAPEGDGGFGWCACHAAIVWGRSECGPQSATCRSSGANRRALHNN
jgi:hypothetical protein